MEISTSEHYDILAEMGHDPVYDPPELAAYMNSWDGDVFFKLIGDLHGKSVLEIGCGSGRLALRAIERGCAAYTGIDISPKTLELARRNINGADNVTLALCSFPNDRPDGLYDVVFSSLTFLHIRDKLRAYQTISDLLAPEGRAVISLSKENSETLDFGDHMVRIYPDDPSEAQGFIRAARLRPGDITETERAYIISAFKI